MYFPIPPSHVVHLVFPVSFSFLVPGTILSICWASVVLECHILVAPLFLLVSASCISVMRCSRDASFVLGDVGSGPCWHASRYCSSPSSSLLLCFASIIMYPIFLLISPPGLVHVVEYCPCVSLSHISLAISSLGCSCFHLSSFASFGISHVSIGIACCFGHALRSFILFPISVLAALVFGPIIFSVACSCVAGSPFSLSFFFPICPFASGRHITRCRLHVFVIIPFTSAQCRRSSSWPLRGEYVEIIRIGVSDSPWFVYYVSV